ncbi:hypothetical protein EUTSA_v10029005mg [Eutrema salsugineum]|uniref:MD-2-related lipid-recognition domain-containing protein n=1 Tax=Eutrema salsugineum TaxID=72664 RepID=V4KL80_EUTSA|nr:MD-2-related lipid-recognition protein 3 [Eutrema salsugineum]ESQ38660.1 hypothetical protein EUTSA_v10029005mg [Eutrema salsugineum]
MYNRLFSNQTETKYFPLRRSTSESMSMSHVQPLLLLLASLLFLPVLCAVDFEYCNKIGYKSGNVTLVKAYPRTGVAVEIFSIASRKSGDLLNRLGFVAVGVILPNNRTKTLKTFNKRYVASPFPIIPGANFKLTILDLTGGRKYYVAITGIFMEPVDNQVRTTLCVKFRLPHQYSAPTLVSV